MKKMRVMLFIFVVLVVGGDTSFARNFPLPDERYDGRDEFGVWNFYAFKCNSRKGKTVSDYKRVVPNGPNPLHNK